MDNKYYTPKIEEFHPGFLYQFHGMTTGGIIFLGTDVSKNIEPSIEIWESEIVGIDPIFSRDLIQIQNILSEGQIRVKYLDKEDIESLGWKLFEEELTERSHFCVFKKDCVELSIQFKNVNNNYPNQCNLRGNGNCSIGHIRIFMQNKSELKKLMQQLKLK